MGEDELQAMLRFYKAMADESRLKLLGVLARQECSVEELATLLRLKEPTISHHLAKLRAVGLVRMRVQGTTHLYRLDGDALREVNRAVLTPERMTSLVGDFEGEAWQRKVLRDFVEGERLKQIPASQKKRSVILAWLVERFEHERRYTEREVNEIITRHHPDPATLRREMVDTGLMQREQSIYWRVDEPATAGQPQAAVT